MTEHYDPAELNEPFYFQRPTRVTDGAGGFTETLARNPVSASDFHFAKVRPLRGSERLVGDGLNTVTSLLFVVYATLGIQVTDTLVYKGMSYNIRRLTPPAGYSIFQEIEAESGVAL